MYSYKILNNGYNNLLQIAIFIIYVLFYLGVIIFNFRYTSSNLLISTAKHYLVKVICLIGGGISNIVAITKQIVATFCHIGATICHIARGTSHIVRGTCHVGGTIRQVGEGTRHIVQTICHVGTAICHLPRGTSHIVRGTCHIGRVIWNVRVTILKISQQAAHHLSINK